MKRTVWDRIERVDVATAMDSAGWDGEDAPTNVAPPAFAKAESSRGNGGFWKGVVVGVGASAMLAGLVTVGGAVIVVAAYGLPTLPAAPAAIARSIEPKAEPVREAVAAPVSLPVVEEPKVAPVVAEIEPVATPATAKVAPRPATKVVARAKPETKRAPVAVSPPTAPVVAKVVATPAPVVTRAPEPPRPNREELLQLALAAKQTRAAPAPSPTPASAPKWEEAEAKQDVAAADEKWVPVDDTETTTSTDSASDDLSKLLGP